MWIINFVFIAVFYYFYLYLNKYFLLYHFRRHFTAIIPAKLCHLMKVSIHWKPTSDSRLKFSVRLNGIKTPLKLWAFFITCCSFKPFSCLKSQYKSFHISSNSEFSALIFSTNIKAPPSTNPLYIRCKTFFLFHKGKNCNVYNDKTKSILANSFISSICCCRNWTNSLLHFFLQSLSLVNFLRLRWISHSFSWMLL